MTVDISIVTRAMEFAADRHRGQGRKDACNTPYINHPISVANLIADTGGICDSNVLAAALLHDTVEDTDATLEDIEEYFSREIRDIVMEVTDDKSLPSKERKRLQVVNASRISYEAKLVKIADKISNLQDMLVRPPENWSLERKREYFDWAKDVIDQLRGTSESLEQLFDRVYKLKP